MAYQVSDRSVEWHQSICSLSQPSDATYSARPVGQPGCGRRLPQPAQLTIREELLDYHNNNSLNKDLTSLPETGTTITIPSHMRNHMHCATLDHHTHLETLNNCE